MRPVFILAMLVGLAVTASGDERFVLAAAERSALPIPARYNEPLPVFLHPAPSYGTWRRRLDTWIDGPSHLEWRLCRTGSPERTRFVDALRRASAGGELRGGVEERVALVNTNCSWSSPAAAASTCDWVRQVVRTEPAGPVRDFFLGRLTTCSGADDLELFEAEASPPWAVVSFHQRHGPLPFSVRLAGVVAELVATGDERQARDAVDVLSKVKDERTSELLLRLHSRFEEPSLRRLLGFGLRHQQSPESLAVYRAEWAEHCEERRAAWQGREEHPGEVLRGAVGYVIAPPRDCNASDLGTEPLPDAIELVATSEPEGWLARRRALAPFGLDRSVAFFSARNGAGAIVAVAPRARILADLVAPALDDVVFEESWPALDRIRYERGPVPAYAFAGRIGFRVSAEGTGDRPDPDQLALIEGELAAALAEPHYLDAYVAGARLRFEISPTEGAIDVAGLVGILNRGALELGRPERFVQLESEDHVAVVVAGTSERLEAAMNSGAQPLGPGLAP